MELDKIGSKTKSSTQTGHSYLQRQKQNKTQHTTTNNIPELSEVQIDVKCMQYVICKGTTQI